MAIRSWQRINIVEDITKPRRDNGNSLGECDMAVTRCTYCIVPSVRGTEQSPHAAIALKWNSWGSWVIRSDVTGSEYRRLWSDLPGVTSEGRHQHTLRTCSYYVHDAQRFRGFGLPPVILVISQSA